MVEGPLLATTRIMWCYLRIRAIAEKHKADRSCLMTNRWFSAESDAGKPAETRSDTGEREFGLDMRGARIIAAGTAKSDPSDKIVT